MQTFIKFKSIPDYSEHYKHDISAFLSLVEACRPTQQGQLTNSWKNVRFPDRMAINLNQNSHVQIKYFFLMANSKTTLFHEWEGPGFYLAQFKTPELAIFSYYLESDQQAVLIDPTYDSYVYQQMAEKRKSKLTSILLTHYHADYIAGHTEFSLPIIMGPKATKPNTKVKLCQMQDNISFHLGSVWIRVLHTPGHTPESSCFELSDNKKNPVCLFTGDTVFLGEVGRPDLAASSNITKEELAVMLFNSIHKIKKEVDPSVRIYPTHGAGSSCGKSIGAGNFCTLEKQLMNNYAFKITSKGEFVERIMSQMPKAPTYFFHDAKINVAGTANGFDSTLKKCMKPLSAENFKAQIDAGCICVDSRHDLTGGAIKGCLLMTEKGALASWAGLVIPPNTNLILFTEPDRAQDLIERLLRIGYFNIQGHNNFTIEQWKAKGYPTWEPKTVSAKELLADENRYVVDVRNLAQWKNGIIQGAKTITLGQIPTRSKQLLGIPNLYVHCKSGWRARLALSILARNGVTGTAVFDEFQSFGPAGLKIGTYPH